MISSLLSQWNWGVNSPQFPLIDYYTPLEKSTAHIHLVQNQDKMLEINGTFYNAHDDEIIVHYKLTVIKLGHSTSSSDQSGNCKVNGKSQVVLSKSTMNLNIEDIYRISLKVYLNNQLIAEDSKTLYGDNLIQS
jgi:hypothetical protein